MRTVFRKNLRQSVQKLSVDLHENERHHNSYDQEQREQECIRQGDMEGLYRSFQEPEQEKVGIVSRDPLRNIKDVSIAVIALASRSAISGGLPAETAFSMSDIFIRQVEAQTTERNVGELLRKSEMEFCLAVKERFTSASNNAAVIRCRDIISQKIHMKITVKDPAVCKSRWLLPARHR